LFEEHAYMKPLGLPWPCLCRTIGTELMGGLVAAMGALNNELDDVGKGAGNLKMRCDLIGSLCLYTNAWSW
jgi:hypothetical protein